MSSSANKFRESLKNDKFFRRFSALFMRMIDAASAPNEVLKAVDALNNFLTSCELSARDIPEMLADDPQNTLFEKVMRAFEDESDALMRIAREVHGTLSC